MASNHSTQQSLGENRGKPRSRRTLLQQAAVMAGLGGAGWLGGAQASASRPAGFPSKPLRFVLPFPTGSSLDTVSRLVGNQLSTRLGTSVVIDNKPGANGILAVQSVLQAPADGHTLLIGSNTTFATNLVALKKIPYEPVRDFAPVTTLFHGPVVLIVPARSPFKTLADLLAHAKANPGRLSFGSGSITYQMFIEQMCQMAGVKALNVSFKGASEVVTAVASGTVDFGMPDYGGARGLIESGTIRALAVASGKRLESLPQVPTIDESGVPGFFAHTWVAAAIRSGAPAGVQAFLDQEISDIVHSEQTQSQYRTSGLVVPPLGAEAFRKAQLAEIDKQRQVMKLAGLEPQ